MWDKKDPLRAHLKRVKAREERNRESQGNSDKAAW